MSAALRSSRPLNEGLEGEFTESQEYAMWRASKGRPYAGTEEVRKDLQEMGILYWNGWTKRWELTQKGKRAMLTIKPSNLEVRDWPSGPSQRNEVERT